jgi:hypothetical protein
MIHGIKSGWTSNLTSFRWREEPIIPTIMYVRAGISQISADHAYYRNLSRWQQDPETSSDEEKASDYGP